MDIDGQWLLTMQTPMGAQQMKLALREENGTLTGTMTNEERRMTAEIFNGTVSGDLLEWKATIKTFRMTLAFSTTVDGDTLSGTGKAGVFGKFGVTGERVS